MSRFVQGVRIVGVSCAVPKNVVKNEDARVVKSVGVAERRHITSDQSLLGLAACASDVLLGSVNWASEDVNALVFVTQTAPRRMPSISCELHDELRLPHDAPAFDLNMACSGYVYGLWVAASLRLPRVLLVVGDTISRFLDARDGSTWPIFGDAVSVTALAMREGPGGIEFTGGTDGSGAESLQVERDELDENKEVLYMDGSAVFNFALSTVPGLIARTTQNAYVDHYLFHQANRLMVEHIARKASVPMESVPFNLERYGNTSSASIPLLMCDSAATEALRTRTNRIAMFGFGAGLSWGGILTDTAPMPLSLVEV